VFDIVTTEYFLRRARKFLKKHPFAPHLAYHPLGGKLKDVQAVSVTYEYRIILRIEVTDQEIILLDIGSHEEVYR
jgi:mRNA-degrading endonuclease YafQ of YafQ-DinJ toxin-antitoxin module